MWKGLSLALASQLLPSVGAPRLGSPMALPSWPISWAYPEVPPAAAATPGVARTRATSEAGTSARSAGPPWALSTVTVERTTASVPW